MGLPFARSSCLLFLIFAAVLARSAGATTCYVNAAASGSNGGTSWANAFTDLQSNSLDIYWVEVDGYTCTGIEHTNGNLADAADGSFTMTGLSVSNNVCLAPAAYSFTLSADGRTLSGSETANRIPMTLTRSSDGNCFVGHWISGGYDLIATIWNFTRQ